MRWEDDGIVLGVRPLGETKKIVTLLTRSYGRHKGVWRRSKTLSIQAGLKVKARWAGRFTEHLGSWTFEAEPNTFMYFLSHGTLLMAAHTAVSLCELLLPEREAAAAVYQAFHHFLATHTLKTYCYFELALLNHTSFPLQLNQCALKEKLIFPAYVSPRTGRAVSGSAAGKYISRLLPLPFFMHNNEQEPTNQDIIQALALTGYFLERYSLHNQGQKLPPLRARLVAQLCERDGGKLAG